MVGKYSVNANKDWFECRTLLSIAHHIPGRLRLKVAGRAIKDFAHADGEALEAWVKSLVGIRQVRVNSLALSIVIDYDTAQIGPTDWDLFFGSNKDRALEVLQRLGGSST